MIESHNERERSPFATLAQLTREIESPALQIAHCIRDLAYGDESRTGDLRAMVQSEEPGYRQIFEEALWRDPTEAKSRTPARKQRRK